MRARHRLLVLALGTSLVFCTTIHGQETSAPAAAPTAEEAVRARLRMGFERAPTRAELAPLAPDLDVTLVAIYRDPTATMLERMRVLDVLATQPSAPLRELLETESARADVAAPLERRLVAAAVRAFRETDPALALSVVGNAVASDDVLVRYDAARALGRFGEAARAEELARTALARETDDDVRRALEASLRTLASERGR